MGTRTRIAMLVALALLIAGSEARGGSDAKPKGATAQSGNEAPSESKDAPAAAKPKLPVASDGFPAGQSTPEGAASDLARAFIRKDPGLFRKICIPNDDADYKAFLDMMVGTMKLEAKRDTPSSDSPKTIQKVFAARHLTLGGPASYGYAAHNYQDVMFVDVTVVLQGDRPFTRRTLVIQDKNGKWYVHPAPNVTPLLSTGLEDETPSTGDFSEAYEVVK